MNKERLTRICKELPTCETLADIGCDHGYITLLALQNGKCKRAIIADVSEACLKKAQNLLKAYIEEERVISKVSNGFENLPPCDVALIAGMGGEEICSILNSATVLPDKLVLQPMKNADKVRTTVVGLGYKIVKDYLFYCGEKYYDLICIEKGSDSLSKEEIAFGRTNIVERSPDFIKYLTKKLNEINSYLQSKRLSQSARAELITLKKDIERYV